MDNNEIERHYGRIVSEDYLGRYDACQKILDAYKIKKSIADVRQVFPYIVDSGLSLPPSEEHKRYRTAQENLKKFIEEYNKPIDFSKLSKTDIDELFLDACHSFSTAPDLGRIKKIFEHGANINVRDENGVSAFAYASHIPEYETIKYFLEHGADINEKLNYSDNSFSTIWLRTVKYRNCDLLKLMLEHGARIGDVDSQGNTAFLNYCDGNPELNGIKLLIKHGAQIKGKNNDGNGALHLLSRNSSAAGSIKFLAEQGADINEKDGVGNTPLIIAVLRENLEAARTLAALGADKSIKGEMGEAAYEIAMQKGYVEIAKAIDPKNAIKDYEARPDSGKIIKIKEQIINKLIGGSKQYHSDKEGYSYFMHRDGFFVFERYDAGTTPPEVSTFVTPEEALQFLYATNRNYDDKETEISVYQRILGSL